MRFIQNIFLYNLNKFIYKKKKFIKKNRNNIIYIECTVRRVLIIIIKKKKMISSCVWKNFVFTPEFDIFMGIIIGFRVPILMDIRKYATFMATIRTYAIHAHFYWNKIFNYEKYKTNRKICTLRNVDPCLFNRNYSRWIVAELRVCV